LTEKKEAEYKEQQRIASEKLEAEKKIYKIECEEIRRIKENLTA
jgi:hypothetical protein